MAERSSLTARIADVATAQKGLITRRQLAQLGLDSSAIDRRAANGTLHRLHQGVYVVGHEALAPLARETAALLACGGAAVISHASAAAIWSMIPPEAAAPDVDVTVVARKLRSRPGLRVHRTARLARADVRRKAAILVTSPAKTLLDMAADRSERLEQAFIEAHGQRLLGPREIEAAIKRAAGHPGVAALRRLATANASGYTRSRAEQSLRTLAQAAGLPQPAVNVQVNGYLVDFLWARERLIVEVDGYGFHGHRGAFENDRKRDAAHVAAGYRVIRVTWLQLNHEPFAVVANIAAALAADGRPQG